jgi:hypothetical protein
LDEGIVFARRFSGPRLAFRFINEVDARIAEAFCYAIKSDGQVQSGE